MPPKRKRRDDVASDSEESDIVSLCRPTATALLPAETLKTKRDRGRKDIAANFDAYAAGKKKAIANHYASEAENRSTEAKALLTLYAEVIARRASIERSIKKLVSNSKSDRDELTILLKAVYTGRRGQLDTATGSIAPIKPKGAVSTPTMNPRHVVDKHSVFDMKGDPQPNERTKEGHAYRW
ncbi:hypothetical protein E0Z10_g9381 [Xylaria hypoxylon]|uniref:Uncharacterized protein n=1 Tax=Xylaria hypoxylon TaxID=37992 RepID=A0A4Z0YJ83_9PEZI|nr:hypothetical protein E0Z10_g9381 [Xylaria hypoxylon]